MNNQLLEILVCPVCKGNLLYESHLQELWCKVDKLAYPIRDAIPVMIAEEARPLREDELQ